MKVKHTVMKKPFHFVSLSIYICILACLFLNEEFVKKILIHITKVYNQGVFVCAFSAVNVLKIQVHIFCKNMVLSSVDLLMSYQILSF